MNLCLAAIQNRLYVLEDFFKQNPLALRDRSKAPIVLESFFYVQDRFTAIIPSLQFFMLDSGAFTLFGSSTMKITQKQLDDYVDRYADYIRDNKIENYIELDIDAIVGLAEVKRIRKHLEERTGIQPIPVWHRSRGLKEWRDMVREYPYVSVGLSGKHDSKWSLGNTDVIRMMIDEAHCAGKKIHGLGFTRLKLLPELHFDSVDSTAWVSGSRFGYLYYFDGKRINKFEKPQNTMIRDFKKITSHNFQEWAKYQQYAKRFF